MLKKVDALNVKEIKTFSSDDKQHYYPVFCLMPLLLPLMLCVLCTAANLCWTICCIFYNSKYTYIYIFFPIFFHSFHFHSIVCLFSFLIIFFILLFFYYIIFFTVVFRFHSTECYSIFLCDRISSFEWHFVCVYLTFFSSLMYFHLWIWQFFFSFFWFPKGK